MEAIQILCTMLHLMGDSAFGFSFSAKSVAEEQNFSLYQCRKHLKSLREYGLIYRMGNRYMFTNDGYCIAKDIIRASQRVHKFQPVEVS